MQADGEEMRNVFFYRKLAAGTNALQFNTLFDAQVIPDIVTLTTSNIFYDRLFTVNMGVPTDFHEFVLGDTGGAVEASLPMHTAINYTLKLNTREIRPGSKRFSGIPEAATNFNIVNNAGYLAFVETLRLQLGADLTDAGNPAWKPVVVKRIPYNPGGGGPPFTSYRLPAAGDPLVVGDVVTVLFNARISHQVSRGNGR